MHDNKKILLKLGFRVEDVDISNKTKEELEEILTNKDIIFVAGGNTF